MDPSDRSTRTSGLAFLVVALLSGLLLWVLPQPVSAAFTTCSITSFTGGTVAGTSLTMNYNSTAILTFNCLSSNVTPSLSGGSGLVTIGQPSHPDANTWAFALTSPAQGGGGVNLTFSEPSDLLESSTQQLSLIINPPPPPTDSNPGGGLPPSTGPKGTPCDSAAGIVRTGTDTRAQLLAKEPGQDAFSEVPASKLCARIYSPASSGELKQASVTVATTADGPWPYPKETVFQVVAKTEGFEASVGGGGIREPKLRTSSDGFVLEGKALWDPKLTPTCVSGSTSGYFSVAITTSQTGNPDLMKGSIGGSNAYQVTGPNLKFPGNPKLQNGTMSYDLLGCGDGDPATIDGFLDSYLSPTFLQSLGINQKLLEMANPAAISALMAANDNGKNVNASYSRERDLADSGWGVRMLYQASFSPHKVAIGSNRKAVAFAKKCSTKRKSKLTGSGKGPKRTLTCTPKKGKSSKLKVG